MKISFRFFGLIICIFLQIISYAQRGCPSVSYTQSVTVCYNESINVGSNTYNTSNTYTDTLSTVISGCDSIVTTILTVSDSIDVSVTVMMPTCPCPGYLIANNTTDAYQWLNCNTGNSVISGATDQTYWFPTTGDYEVIVTEGLCADTSDCIYSIYTGITNLDESENRINLYPNPASYETNLILNHQDAGPVNISIVSILGQIIIDSVVITDPSEENKIALDTKILENGIYIVKIKEGENLISKRLIVNH
jgi:hypothetical protein